MDQTQWTANQLMDLGFLPALVIGGLILLAMAGAEWLLGRREDQRW